MRHWRPATDSVKPSLSRNAPGRCRQSGTPNVPGATRHDTRRVVSAETSRSLCVLLRRNVAEQAGTGRRADVPGYRVGGKTGTAEMPGRGGYQEKSVVSSFVAGFPMDEPKYLVLVLIFEPKGTDAAAGEVLAGRNAAPTAGRVIARIAPLLGVRPVHDVAQLTD